MDIKTLMCQKTQHPTKTTDVWVTGQQLLRREQELRQTCESQGCTTLDEIILSEGIGSRTEGRLLLQIIRTLDPAIYTQYPLSKLRYLVQLENELDRQAFLKEHDIHALSVRQLHAEVKAWKNAHRSHPKENQALESKSGDDASPRLEETSLDPQSDEVLTSKEPANLLRQLVELLERQRNLSRTIVGSCEEIIQLLNLKAGNNTQDATAAKHACSGEK